MADEWGLATGPGTARRCLVVVAAAGYGKTSYLRTRLGDVDTAWSHDADVPTLVAGGLKDLAARVDPGWVVLDDLPRLPAAQANDLLETVALLPTTVGVAIASRWPLGAAVSRWRGRGLVAEVPVDDLALTVDQVAALLADSYGLRDPHLAVRAHDATAGWPAVVRLVAETLADAGEGLASVEAMVDADTPLAAYLVDEVIGTLPAPVLRFVRDLAPFAPISAPLGAALGHRGAGPTIATLTRLGLLTNGRGGTTRRARIVPVLAAAARAGTTRSTDAARAALAARWYDQHGPPLAAARAFLDAGDDEECVRVLAARGAAMLGAGDAQAVTELIAALPGPVRGQSWLELLLGDALRTAGDVAAAERAYRGVAERTPQWTPAVAWRVGNLHYLRAEPHAALEAFARGHPASPPTADDVVLSAWTAAAYLSLGDETLASQHAQRAIELGHTVGDDAARASAHITYAMCLAAAGDPAGCAQHDEEALRLAERAGDLLLITRIHNNRIGRTQRFPDALATARLAVRSAQAAGHANLLSIAMCNEALSLAGLGRYDEAADVYERVVAASQRMGSRRVAAALVGLGDVYRRRGWHQQARSAYEESVRLTRDGGDNQALVLALAGLARVVAADDPASAAALADEAVASAAGPARASARLGQGWVAVRRGDRTTALDIAGDVADLARRQRDRLMLAEALELHGTAELDPRRAHAALSEAHGIWSDAGASVDADRVRAIVGRLPGASTEDRLGALLATRRLAAADVGPAALRAVTFGDGAQPDAPVGPPVSVRTLGRFEVVVENQAVPASAWQSRKARDLLRILLTRRGRPVPRGELSELLWPDDDPTRTGHRLSVLLSIVRSVLDPNGSVPAGHFLVADQASAALDISRLRVDVEEFLADVGHAARLRRRGELAQARTLFEDAERRYVGDLFEDEPYADWAAPLAEEARMAYLRAVRSLAELTRATGDLDQAAHHLLQLLRLDPYDEWAHRQLVQVRVVGGQHGEARRAFQRYGEAMRAIGVRPPDPTLLAARG